MYRFTRQVRLPEVGEAGQARLAAASIAPSGAGFAREIEVAYLRAAGVGSVREAETSARSVDVEALGIRDRGARELAEGALRALVALREVILT